MSGKTEVPEEAVEATAKGLARHKWPTAMGVWDSFGQGMKDDFRDQARAALEAAAPFIAANALEGAADELARLPYAKPDAPERPEYERLLAVRRGDADKWLRARAAAVRGEG